LGQESRPFVVAHCASMLDYVDNCWP
jgi:hypothetical protein